MNTKASKKANKGFTLMELIIVLALLAIITAILIPMFLSTTDRARLRSDIQSARVIQNAMDLYRIERGSDAGNTSVAILSALENADYISSSPSPQTAGATWGYDEDTRHFHINITNSPLNIRELVSSLSEAEREMVVGGTTP